MRLIVQPDDGIASVLTAVKRAKKSIDVVVFRFDLPELEKALEAGVARGVAVRALIAHTNGGGEKKLRQLESRLLAAGVTVTRTGDELMRYHGKLLLIDASILFVLGFNYTRLDIRKSRSFGIVTRKREVVQQTRQLIDADASRQTFTPASPDLVVSPENARDRLTRFIKKAQRRLLIYDPYISDDAMIRLLKERAKRGVKIRILGLLEKKWLGPEFKVARFPGERLHVRAMIRDGRRAFVGSQSLRKPELDLRREVGLIVRDRSVVKRLEAIFKADWRLTK